MLLIRTSCADPLAGSGVGASARAKAFPPPVAESAPVDPIAGPSVDLLFTSDEFGAIGINFSDVTDLK